MTEVLLVGLSTVDLVQRVEAAPHPGEKVQSTSVETVAGGPATNAAVAVAALGGRARLLTALGAHPLAELARRDLAEHGVELVDVRSDGVSPPPVSAAVVRERDGERTVVSHNAAGVEVLPPDDLDGVLGRAAAVLVDGHHPRLALAAAETARRRGVPVVLDAGSYKPVLVDLLPLVDVCACSEAFRLPDRPDDTDRALHDLGIPVVTRTRGQDPVSWSCRGGGEGTVRPSEVTARDTLGAGDVWHGALAFGIVRLGRVPTADDLPGLLAEANEVAALRVRHRGARAWVAAARSRGSSIDP
ncbi:PfkB family carbohydrate kinase [Saccharopolyspora rosea]|uniref:PfkB family carbohydrate kinase n=1 Tax=Saccharopolyspora rosea TaxID=524884 RepID=UPI0021DB5181|nr:PfkB family carbohydrate kinase [Saccharopolyspora rosea]